jgi:hypothetical protein
VQRNQHINTHSYFKVLLPTTQTIIIQIQFSSTRQKGRKKFNDGNRKHRIVSSQIPVKIKSSKKASTTVVMKNCGRIKDDMNTTGAKTQK